MGTKRAYPLIITRGYNSYENLHVNNQRGNRANTEAARHILQLATTTEQPYLCVKIHQLTHALLKGKTTVAKTVNKTWHKFNSWRLIRLLNSLKRTHQHQSR